MPRTKKADLKPVEKSKTKGKRGKNKEEEGEDNLEEFEERTVEKPKATAKRRKAKEDEDDLNEFEEKPAEKSKTKGKRRKAKEEDDDLKEFEQKPEKKLKVEGQNNGKQKICVAGYFNQMSPGSYFAEVHTFKDLATALGWKDGVIESLQQYGNLMMDGDYLNNHTYCGHGPDGNFFIKIKEITFDELLAGIDVNLIFDW